MERVHYTQDERRVIRLARRMLDEVFCQGNLERLPEVVEPNSVLRHPVPWLGFDADGFAAMTRAFHDAFPGFDVVLDEMLVRGNLVVLRWTIHGTHRGTWMGVSATGVDVAVPALGYFVAGDAGLTEASLHVDGLHLLHQLGRADMFDALRSGGGDGA
jgi:predicted ester cyclase